MASPPRVKNPAAAARYGTLASAILALAAHQKRRAVP